MTATPPPDWKTREWIVVNDRIGSYSIWSVWYPSMERESGCYECVASDLAEEVATHFVKLHNDDLKRQAQTHT